MAPRLLVIRLASISKDKEHAMQNLNNAVAMIGIDIGKNGPAAKSGHTCQYAAVSDVRDIGFASNFGSLTGCAKST